MLDSQIKMSTSPYQQLYDLIVDENHQLRKLHDIIDYSFVHEELRHTYSENMGRKAVEPIVLFKYLMLKVIYELSDVDVVKRSKTDLAFKFFLDMAPEEEVIDPSLLTKFRKLRLKDEKLLNQLLARTIILAKEKDLLKNHTLIVDSTHTKSRYNKKSARTILLEQAKKVRRQLYEIDENLRDKLPTKPTNSGVLEDTIAYCEKLVEFVEKKDEFQYAQKLMEQKNLLKEFTQDHNEALKESYDEDARVGHKSYDESFFGYKTHIGMTPERIIAVAHVTSGEKNDGKQLKDLIRISEENGYEVDEIIGDAAYSEKENIEYAKENDIILISKLNRAITHSNKKSKIGFEFNKDANTYQCPGGHLSIKKVNKRPRQNAVDGKGDVETYFFDIEKCRECSLKKGCYKDGANTKSHSISLKSNTHLEYMAFQETDFFKERAKERYKIEAKNSELKHSHGFEVASGSGLFGMRLQSAVTMFTVNLKRILKLLDEKEA